MKKSELEKLIEAKVRKVLKEDKLQIGKNPYMQLDPSTFYAFKQAVNNLRLTRTEIGDLDHLSNLLKDLYEKK